MTRLRFMTSPPPFHCRHAPQTVSADGWDFSPLALLLFNEMRLPASACWKCPSVVNACVCRRGGSWPRSCLSLSQINSNCGLQLFAAGLPDVRLFSEESVEQNGPFLMQMGGMVKGSSTWTAEVWEESLSRLASLEWLFNASKHKHDPGSVPKPPDLSDITDELLRV